MKILLTVPHFSSNPLHITWLKTLSEKINTPFQYTLSLKMTTSLHVSLPTPATLTLECGSETRILQGHILKYSQFFEGAYHTTFLFCSPLCLLQLKQPSQYFPQSSLGDFLTLLLPCPFLLSAALNTIKLPPLFQTNEKSSDFLHRQLAKIRIQYLHQYEDNKTTLVFFKNLKNTSLKHWKLSTSHTGHLVPTEHSIVQTNIIYDEKNEVFQAKSNCPLIVSGDSLLLLPMNILFRVIETHLIFKKGKIQHRICYIPATHNSTHHPVVLEAPQIMSATIQGKQKDPAMDDTGKYSTYFHFNLHNKKNSLPLIKMQSHPGVQFGLRKKTEVAIGFAENLPFILGCHYNHTHSSPTTQTNPEEHILTTDSEHQWIRHDGTKDCLLSTAHKHNGLSFQGKNDRASTSLFSKKGKLSLHAKMNLILESGQSQIHHTNTAEHFIQQDYLLRSEKSFSLVAAHNQTWQSPSSIRLESYADTITLHFNTLNTRANHSIVLQATEQWQMRLNNGGLKGKSTCVTLSAKQTNRMTSSDCALDLTSSSIVFSGNVMGNSPSITFFS